MTLQDLHEVRREFPSVFEDLFSRAIMRRSKAEKLSKDAMEYYRTKYGKEKSDESQGPADLLDVFGSRSRVSLILEESKKM